MPRTRTSPAKFAKPPATETIAPPAEPKRRRLKLVGIEDVRRELARLYRAAKAGEVDTQDASRLANILAILSRLIEGSDIEQRLAALEESGGGRHARIH